jgi:phospholipase/carboxylesterase
MERSDAIRPGGPSKERAASSLFGIPSGWLNLPAHDSARAAFVPLHYEPKYAYPLIVWLHGPGNDERQLFEIMPPVSRRNYVAVAPRGFRIGGQQPGEEVWGWPQTCEHIPQAEQRIFDSIAMVCHKLHVAPGRIFLAGAEAGGTMAFRVAMSYPTRFAGVLSLGGAFPTGQTPLGQWTTARSLTVFLAIGRDSLPYPPARA